MGEHDEFIADFLEECDENLDQLDQELVALEENPRDDIRLRSIFRNVHTIKGSSGFFGFAKIGSISHEGETLLGKLRDGDLFFNQEIASALLLMSDAIRELLADIEQTGREGEKDYSALHDRLISLSALEAGPSSNADTGTAGGALAGEVDDDPTENDRPDISEDGQDDAVAGVAGKRHPATNKTKDSVHHDSHDGSAAEDDKPDGPRHGHDTIEPDSPTVSEQSTRVLGVGEESLGVAKTGDPTTIRVDVALLDQLMDLAGELVLARNSLNRCGDQIIDPRLSAVASRVSQITTDIQDRVTQTRMLPIGSIWGRFRRIVRDLAVECGKQVRLDLQGEETELDRSLIEAIKDPLTHLIRNSVDHGIEEPEKRIAAQKNSEGLVRLHAKHERGQVVIEVTDDGAGIDVDRIVEKAISKNLVSLEDAGQLTPQDILQFIFEPGFSTAKTISAISGRGVGMDVVRSHVERIGGSVHVRSELGVGTTFTIHLPLTLAIVPALVLRSKDQLFAVPQASLTEVVNLGDSIKVEWIHEVPVCRLRGQLLPLVWLDQVLGGESVPQGGDGTTGPDPRCHQVAVLQVDQLRFGLVLDEVMNSQEVVVKPIGGAVKAIGAYSAATILGDGLVALILDVSGIARLAGLSPDLNSRIHETASVMVDSRKETTATNHSVSGDRSLEDIAERSYLICEVREGREVAIGMDRVERLEEIAIRGLQRFDGHVVTNYRGSVLRVRDLFDLVDAQAETTGQVNMLKPNTPLIICRHSDSRFGLLVKQILDVVSVDDVSDANQGIVAENGMSEAVGDFALVNGRVVEVLDMQREYQLALGVGG